MTERFEGKTALVTGGASGMGRATSLAFAAAGANVVIADIATNGAEETAELIREIGGSATVVRCDVSSASDVETMVATAVSVYGRLDCAMNGAAIETEVVPLADCEESTYDRILAVNLKSVFLCLKYEIRAMLQQGGPGAIVNIASTNAFTPQPNQPAYTASKHGVLGITKSAALDYAASGIRINAVCPGAIETPMLLGAIAARGRDVDEVAGRLSVLGRFGQPAEIAKAVLWLCSEESSFTVGHALAGDGGLLLR